jgi:light-harvesting complex I chlorophyll a/b binding protein 1
VPCTAAPDACPARSTSQSSKASPAKFARWRAVEIKHGRIAMMATTGYIAQSCFRFGGYLSTSANIKFADVPNGIKGLAAVPPLGLAQILLFIGLMECGTWRFYEGSWPGSVPAGKAPGDVAGEFWVRYTDPAEKKSKLNIELNNGRAAMMGITGMLMHDHLTGSWVPPGF